MMNSVQRSRKESTLRTSTKHYGGNGPPMSETGHVTRHEEWLMDEAIRDSFPASDPASFSQPGSIVYERYALARG
jgi:hypothetical protein